MIFINILVHRSMMDVENGFLSKTLKSDGYGQNREYGEFKMDSEWNDEFEYGMMIISYLLYMNDGNSFCS